MSNMPSVTIIVGVVLALYGGYSYSISESKSITALIPAFFGAAFIVLGLLAMKDKLRKHAMHLAAVVGLLGFLGGAAMGGPKLPGLMTGKIREGKTEAEATKAENAAKSQVLLGVVCLVFVGMCVNSFIQARRARQAAGNSSQAAK